MCTGTGRDQSTLERLQGYQRGNYGVGHRYAMASGSHDHILPYRGQDGGNAGAAPFNPIPVAVPLVGVSGYGGSLPLTQQPRIDIPQPYTWRYVGA
jgi:hypothetical protein